MAMTVNNVNTLSLLNILNRTTTAQSRILDQMATGSKINKGSDDPSGLLALTRVQSELTAVNAGISNNQKTDAILGVADGSLTEVASLVDEIQRLANESSNSSALSAEELAANQSQIDSALASIDRIIQSSQFNGKKLLDGSLGIANAVGNAGALTDVKVFSKPSSVASTALTVKVTVAASQAVVSQVMTNSATVDSTFTVQGALGVAVISVTAGENISSVAYKINQAKGQTGVSAAWPGAGNLRLYSTAFGAGGFVRTSLIAGDNARINNKYDTGIDASVTVNGQATAVSGKSVNYSGGGVAVSFQIGTLGAGAASSTTITVTTGGATFNLGTNSSTRSTIGIDGVYTFQLGNNTTGYLSSLASGGANSLLSNPGNAADIARLAAGQVAQLKGQIGGFQKFQVRTALNSLNDTKVGLETVKGVIRDVDYAIATAELNKQNILLQSGISLLGLVNQQSAQVLSLLK
jgi:flagellin